jgi:hypothetical protein
MPTPDTETLAVPAGRGRDLLVPALCGIVVASSWAAGCLAIVLPT